MSSTRFPDLTNQEAYLAMYQFLSEEYELLGRTSGDIAGLLSDLSLLENGFPVDPAALDQWERACRLAKQGAVDASLRIDRDIPVQTESVKLLATKATPPKH